MYSKKLYVVLLILCSFFAHSQELALSPTKSGLYDVGGFKLFLECYENGKPTLILEQGFGRSGSDGVWLENINQLKDSFSICLYDRAGLGKSEKGPIPFAVYDMASRLHQLLQVAKVKPPYYFAGGSYASYIIRAYNNLFADDVLGAVLIAPPPFGYFYTMGTRWPDDFKTDNEQLRRYYQFEMSVNDPMFSKVPENIDHMQSHQQLLHVTDFGQKPLIILFSKKTEQRYDPPFVPDDIAQVMTDLYQQSEQFYKVLSDNSRVIYSQSEKHHLHITDRDLVVKSIKNLLTQTP